MFQNIEIHFVWYDGQMFPFLTSNFVVLNLGVYPEQKFHWETPCVRQGKFDQWYAITWKQCTTLVHRWFCVCIVYVSFVRWISFILQILVQLRAPKQYNRGKRKNISWSNTCRYIHPLRLTPDLWSKLSAKLCRYMWLKPNLSVFRQYYFNSNKWKVNFM